MHLEAMPRSHTSTGDYATAAPTEVDVRLPQSDVFAWLTIVHPRELRATFPLGAAVRRLGRCAEADWAIPLLTVSRLHAELTWDGDVHRVRDLGSRHGVSVSGARVTTGALGDGSVVRLGDAIAVYEREQSWLPFAPGVGGLPGESGAARRLRHDVLRVAFERTPVLIAGEPGAGTTHFARVIHATSGRPGQLVVQGEGPSDALVDGGSLLLESAGELPGRGDARADVRVLATTRAPSASAPPGWLLVRVPPLRERRRDLFDLLELFWQRRHGGRHGALPPPLSADLAERLLLIDFPDNLRGLEGIADQLARLPPDRLVDPPALESVRPHRAA